MAGRSWLKAIAALGLLVISVDRFIPAISLSLIPHESASPPDVSSEPRQELIQQEERGTLELPRKSVVLVPRAHYDIAAEVVGIERYRLDGAAFVIPWDVALRWGDLVRPPMRKAISYHQDARFFFWGTYDTSLDRGYIVSHSANVHVIPASAHVAAALARVRCGDDVEMVGELVEIQGTGRRAGFRWGTSLSRTDTDAHSCETLYLTSLNVDGKLYR